MPASMRSNGRSSSAQHHSTFWTLIEFVRPQILSMLHLSRYALVGAPPLRKGGGPSNGADTVGEITIRRQKPLVLRIMVEQGRTRILFLSGLTPRCEQIFPHRCCFQPVRRIRQRCPDTAAEIGSTARSSPTLTPVR